MQIKKYTTMTPEITMNTLNEEDTVWDDVSKAEWILRNNWHDGLPYYYYNTTTNKLSLQNVPPWVAKDSTFCEAYIGASAEEKTNFLRTGIL